MMETSYFSSVLIAIEAKWLFSNWEATVHEDETTCLKTSELLICSYFKMELTSQQKHSV